MASQQRDGPFPSVRRAANSKSAWPQLQIDGGSWQPKAADKIPSANTSTREWEPSCRAYASRWSTEEQKTHSSTSTLKWLEKQASDKSPEEDFPDDKREPDIKQSREPIRSGPISRERAIRSKDDIGLLSEHFTKSWTGSKGESYEFGAGQFWRAASGDCRNAVRKAPLSGSWQCVRDDAQWTGANARWMRGTRRQQMFTVRYDAPSRLAWWGAWTYFFDPADILANSDVITWYAYDDRAKKNAVFSWSVVQTTESVETECAEASAEESEQVSDAQADSPSGSTEHMRQDLCSPSLEELTFLTAEIQLATLKWLEQSALDVASQSQSESLVEASTCGGLPIASTERPSTQQDCEVVATNTGRIAVIKKQDRRKELAREKLGSLRKIACDVGVTDDEFNEALNHGDPKAAVIEVIMERDDFNRLPKASKTCPGGHHLRAAKTPDGACCACDSCGQDIQECTILYGCRDCNYDECEACVLKEHVERPLKPQPPAQPPPSKFFAVGLPPGLEPPPGLESILVYPSLGVAHRYGNADADSRTTGTPGDNTPVEIEVFRDGVPVSALPDDGDWLAEFNAASNDIETYHVAAAGEERKLRTKIDRQLETDEQQRIAKANVGRRCQNEAPLAQGSRAQGWKQQGNGVSVLKRRAIPTTADLGLAVYQ